MVVVWTPVQHVVLDDPSRDVVVQLVVQVALCVHGCDDVQHGAAAAAVVAAGVAVVMHDDGGPAVVGDAAEEAVLAEGGGSGSVRHVVVPVVDIMGLVCGVPHPPESAESCVSKSTPQEFA